MTNKNQTKTEKFYNGKKIADWIEWAENEIEEYKKFIRFLKRKEGK